MADALKVRRHQQAKQHAEICSPGMRNMPSMPDHRYQCHAGVRRLKATRRSRLASLRRRSSISRTP